MIVGDHPFDQKHYHGGTAWPDIAIETFAEKLQNFVFCCILSHYPRNSIFGDAVIMLVMKLPFHQLSTIQMLG